MTTSTATTKVDTGEALRQFFESHAITALGRVIAMLQERDLYELALNKLEQGEDLSTDLPEIKDVTPAAAKKVMQRMVADSDKAVFSAWELPSNVGKLYHTTVRSHKDEMSLLPCFDVEYKAEAANGIVKIAVKTWRRNAAVTVEGKAAALDSLHGQVVMAGMRSR
jgi:hypothetical protein